MPTLTPRFANWLVLLLIASTTANRPSEALGQNPEAPPRIESASEPIPKDGSWLKMHEAFLKRAQAGGNIGLLFLGDSITQGWSSRNGEGEGPAEVWETYYSPRHSANFGISGDRVQHLLWRIENGEVDGIKPKVVVVMIGTNNVGANTPAEVAEGIKLVVDRLRQKLPTSKILLLGIFPRGRKADSTRDRNKAVNERIARLDDGRFVTYLDLTDKFVEADGSITKEMMPDALHLSKKGYKIWAEAMEPTLKSLMGEP